MYSDWHAEKNPSSIDLFAGLTFFFCFPSFVSLTDNYYLFIKIKKTQKEKESKEIVQATACVFA